MIYNSESKEELSKMFTNGEPSPVICQRVYALKNTDSANIQERLKLRKQCQNIDRQYFLMTTDFITTGISGQIFNYNIENSMYMF